MSGSRSFSSGVLVAVVSMWLVPASSSRAQDDTKGDRYEQYVFLKESIYTPGKGKNGKQTLTLKFDLSPDVPKGAKVNFDLEYQGLGFVNTDYVLKSEARKGLVLRWQPEKRLPLDEFFLRSRIYLDNQSPAVRKLIAAKKKFPESNDPFPWMFFDQPIKIGTDEEVEIEKAAICEIYEGLIAKLVENKIEFETAMGEVQEGKKCVSGGRLNGEEFEKLVVDWRKKQGEVQKEIGEFPVKEEAYWQKSKTAHRELGDLARMVSKDATRLQKDVSKQYGADPINPNSHPNFNDRYCYRVSKSSLNRKVERVYELVCPSAEGAAEEAAEDAGDGDG